jgi:uncharacterized protein (TIRG00374 family)
VKRRYWLLALTGLGLGVGIPILVGGRALLPVLERLQAGQLAMLLGMIFVAWNFNAGRIRLLTGGMGYRLKQGQALAILMATEFAICATPGATGGPVTYAWLLHRLGLPTGRGIALYAVDQLIDMMFFVTALGGVALYWLIVPSDLHLGWQIVVLSMLLLGGMALAWWVVLHYRRVLLASGRLLRRFSISSAGRRRLARWALEFRRSLRLVQQFSAFRLWAVYFLCVGHWLLRYSILYFAVRAAGSSIPWSYAFIVQMLSLTAGQATLLPGGSGGAEASSSLLLMPYMDAGTVAGAVLVWRFVTFYWYLIAGAPVFAMLAGRPLWRRLGGSGSGTVSQS